MVLNGEVMSEARPATILQVSKAFSVTFKSAKSMLRLVQSPEINEEVGIVHTGKKKIRLAAGQVSVVYVKASSGAQFQGQSLLLVPCDEPTLPEGEIIEEGLVSIPTDKSMYVPIPIANVSKQAVTLNKCSPGSPPNSQDCLSSKSGTDKE